MTCEHHFDVDDLFPDAEYVYPPIYSGTAGSENGIPTALEARLTCQKCGDKVRVEYSR